MSTTWGITGPASTRRVKRMCAVHLCEAGFTKQDVRDLAKQLNLPVWDKPAMPCLSSRIPYEQAVTPEKLKMIEQAEDFLIALGFTQLRVRHYGDTARIELPSEDLPRFYKDNLFEPTHKRFLEIGFNQVTVDPEGFRSGRLNEAMSSEIEG